MSLSDNFEAYSLQNEFVFAFRLGVEDEKDMPFFFLFGGIHLQNLEKNREHNTYRPRFLSNCVISLVQQWYAYQV